MPSESQPEESGDAARERPLLFLDVDGVISLFGFEDGSPGPGPYYWIDGRPHSLDAGLDQRIARLAEAFELVWATGWEHLANDHFAAILRLPALPVLTFDGRAVFGSADWKLDALDAYAGDRPAAWIDDNLDDACHRWADERTAPTLLIDTHSTVGLTDADVDEACAWAATLDAGQTEQDTAPESPLLRD